MSTPGEREPLLPANSHATPNAHRLLQVSKYVNVNVPWLMSVRNTIQWLLTVVTVWSSYYYIRMAGKTFIPKCWEYNGKALLIACNATGMCFWTFPLLCVIIVIITFWRHLYESRLYYECILHRILVNYDNDAASKSPLTWTYMIYGFLAVSVVWFVSPDPLDDKPLIQGLVIYLSPLVSFFMVFLSLWQVEGQLLPLPKFYETDPKLAQEVLSQAVYSTDDVLRVAFEEVEEILATKERDEPLTSGEYFGLLFEAVKTETSKLEKNVPEVDESTSITDRFMASLGLERIEEYGFSGQVSRPDVFTWQHLFRKRNWWVHRLLGSPNFRDDRAVSFRHWALAHNIVASFCLLCVLEVYISTIADWFKEQRAHVIN